MRFEHEGVVALLLGSRLADGDNAGDISRAIQIVCTGVDQQNTLPFNGAMVFWGGGIVR